MLYTFKYNYIILMLTISVILITFRITYLVVKSKVIRLEKTILFYLLFHDNCQIS